MADYSDKRHSEVSDEGMYHKWWTGLEKSKVTLDITPKIDLRLAIFPLDKRYRIDLLSHKPRRLSVKLYTATIFADQNSMQGNKYAQIYTDGNIFVHLLLMRSKAGAGDSLGNVVKDIGNTNEIHCDNTLEQVWTNVEFIIKARKYTIIIYTTESYLPYHNKEVN